MIEIIIYNNGFEIKGHAVQHICSEVSVLAFTVPNELFYEGISARYYTSCMDGNISNEGLTWVILNKNCEKSMHQLELYKYNIERWKHNWKNYVSVIEVDADLIK